MSASIKSRANVQSLPRDARFYLVDAEGYQVFRTPTDLLTFPTHEAAEQCKLEAGWDDMTIRAIKEPSHDYEVVANWRGPHQTK